MENIVGGIRSLALRQDCYLLIGAQAVLDPGLGYVETVPENVNDDRAANSAILFSPEGAYLERYDKMHLVPFGEYIPLADWLPFLRRLTPLSHSLRAGRSIVVFELKDLKTGAASVKVGPLICYEDVPPSLVRRFRLGGADFFVNLTEEGWYRPPGELWQHAAMAVFRAVENRATMVRAANTGISCFIAPDGRIYATVSREENGHQRMRDVMGAISAPIQLCPKVPFYARHGDVFAGLCAAVALAALTAAGMERLRSRRTSAQPEQTRCRMPRT